MSDSGELPYAAEPGGVRLAVRVTPRANRTGLNGIIRDVEGRPCLAVRLAAPPVEGAANKALIRFLADVLAIRASDVHVRSGETARLKMMFIAGEHRVLLARLAAFVAPGGG